MLPLNAVPKSGQDPVSKLIYELSKLPGIGEKTATRLTYHILKQDEAYATALSEALLSAKQKIRLCEQCFTFTDRKICQICSNTERDFSLLCVVERPSDVFSIEATHVFKGYYHVLHGALSPLDGVGPEELKIRELLARLHPGTDRSVLELIVATNPSVEGEATALYLSRLIKPTGIRLTKLASGLPVGGLLEYTDRQTIGKALENRMEIG
ncbi:recombination mediator RecR [Bdellovibrionota bacterium FG-1]